MGVVFSTKCDERTKPTCDAFRETPLRLLGYATHIGNACSALLAPNIANVPSMVTTAYICTDVFTKTLKSSEEGKCRSRVAIDAGDAIIWQMLATILIPGIIINKIKYYTVKSTAHAPTSCSPPPPLVKAFPAPIVRALPCIFGVLAIPIIMYPVDKVVTLLMDFTYRAAFQEENSEELKKPKPETKRTELEKKPEKKPEKIPEKKPEKSPEKNVE